MVPPSQQWFSQSRSFDVLRLSSDVSNGKKTRPWNCVKNFWQVRDWKKKQHLLHIYIYIYSSCLHIYIYIYCISLDHFFPNHHHHIFLGHRTKVLPQQKLFWQLLRAAPKLMTLASMELLGLGCYIRWCEDWGAKKHLKNAVKLRSPNISCRRWIALSCIATNYAVWWHEWHICKLWICQRKHPTNLRCMIYKFPFMTSSRSQNSPVPLATPCFFATGHGLGTKGGGHWKEPLRFQVSVQHCLGPHGCHKHCYKHLPETVDPMAIGHLGNMMTHFVCYFFELKIWCAV